MVERCSRPFPQELIELRKAITGELPLTTAPYRGSHADSLQGSWQIFSHAVHTLCSKRKRKISHARRSQDRSSLYKPFGGTVSLPGRSYSSMSLSQAQEYRSGPRQQAQILSSSNVPTASGERFRPRKTLNSVCAISLDSMRCRISIFSRYVGYFTAIARISPAVHW